MCGVVGVVSKTLGAQIDVLMHMRDTMRHRGPDDAGFWSSTDGRVALAHRRLAIIDLSPGGHQPMTDEKGDLCIVFNGEIYNYREVRGALEGRLSVQNRKRYGSDFNGLSCLGS